MNYLSLCAIVRDEGLYIEEWLRYHRLLGVEHFYIYDHNSVDRTVDIAKAFGHVTIRPMKEIQYVSAQCGAYTECLKEFRNHSRWIGFIDIDEFICPITDTNFHAILQNYEEAPSLGVHWRLFGSSGAEVYSPAPVLERFTRREVSVNRHIKSFVNPQRTDRYISPHKFHHVNAFAVDENYKTIGTYVSTPPDGTCNIVQINHYVTKSKEECLLRRSRPRADTGKMHGEDFFNHHDRNEVEDFRARDIWRAVRKD